MFRCEGDLSVTGKDWLPPRDSNPDMLIQSQPNFSCEIRGNYVKNQLLPWLVFAVVCREMCRAFIAARTSSISGC